MDYIQIYISCESCEQAQKLVSSLLDKRWVACGQVISGVKSFYRWDGLIEENTEALLILKTKSAYFCQIERYVLKHHSYQIPEILAVPVELGHKPYLKWIEDNTK